VSDLSEYRQHLCQIEASILDIEQHLCLLGERKEIHLANGVQAALSDERFALLSDSHRLLQLRRLQILDKIESTAAPFSRRLTTPVISTSRDIYPVEI
jgi:hypothetical protein